MMKFFLETALTLVVWAIKNKLKTPEKYDQLGDVILGLKKQKD